MKNLINGKLASTALRPASALKGGPGKSKADYMYTDGSGVHFMDQKSFEQISIDADVVRRASTTPQEERQSIFSILTAALW